MAAKQRRGWSAEQARSWTPILSNCWNRAEDPDVLVTLAWVHRTCVLHTEILKFEPANILQVADVKLTFLRLGIFH